RWLRYMPQGIFKHDNVAASPQKTSECAVGWIAHYTIGVMFALAFVLLATTNWLHRPSLLAPLLFGAGTVLVPFFIMQPSFGLGIAASKTPNPIQARLRSLMTHVVFGVGLYRQVLLAHI